MALHHQGGGHDNAGGRATGRPMGPSIVHRDLARTAGTTGFAATFPTTRCATAIMPIIGRVAGHLTYEAGTTEKGTATIFGLSATSRGNVVPRPHVLTCPNEQNQDEQAKGEF